MPLLGWLLYAKDAVLVAQRIHKRRARQRKACAMPAQRKRPIPQGAKAGPFVGNEFVVPPSAFDTFNSLRESGSITITPLLF